MKLLRNPIVTASLVIVAVAVVVYQLMSPRMGLGRRFNAPTLASASPPSSSALAPKSPAKPAASRGTAAGKTWTNRIDRSLAEVRFESWVDWPKRDPFLVITPEPEDALSNMETNSPVSTWKLKAIWAQTGGRVAVINRGNYREGDEIEGYRIDKIDTGGVWFIGPKEKERLGFDTKPKPASTNAVPAAAKP